MTTRAQFVAAVRQELQDAGPSYLWADGLLQGYVNDGLNALSLDLPPTKEFTLAAVAGQRDYVIGLATCVISPRGVRWVQFPAGKIVLQGDTSQQSDGFFLSGSGQPFEQCYELIEGLGDTQTLRFRYGLTQSGTILVRAYTTYALPVADSSNLDLSVSDEIVLRWAVCRMATLWLEQNRAKGAGTPPGRRSSAEYERLYQMALTSRRAALGIKSSVVTVG